MTPESAEWLERTILHNEIYYAPAATFNDPFELSPTFSFNAPPERHREDFLRMSRKFEPHLTEEQHQHAADAVVASSLSAGDIAHTEAVMQAMHTGIVTET